MRKILILSLVFIIPMLSMVSVSIADTPVNGAVSGRWVRNLSPYLVTANITLARTDTLIIEPGVVVRFNNGTQFDIAGILLATGTERDSIYFVSTNNTPGDFRWIKFEGITAADSRLKYCVVRYSERGIHIIDSDPEISNSNISYHSSWLLRGERSRSKIKDCVFAHSTVGSGVVVDVSSRMEIRDSHVHNTRNSGIAVTGNASLNVINCNIERTQAHGIYLTEAGLCSLVANRVDRTTQRGIYVYQSNNPILIRNIVTGSAMDYALYVYRCDNVQLFNNTIWANDRTGLGFVNSNGLVVNNIIALNNQDGFFSQSSQPMASYNNVWSNGRDNYSGVQADETDHSVNPMLDNDFAPQQDSPMIDVGHPTYRDPDGTRSDIGAKFFNQNVPPRITSSQPEQFDRIEGDNEIQFSVEAVDDNEHHLTYSWFLNNVPMATGPTWTYMFDMNGSYNVKVVVDDNYYLGKTTHEWNFEVYGASAPDNRSNLPREFALGNPYPNPFNNGFSVTTDLPMSGVVRITLWDMLARQQVVLYEGWLQSGYHHLNFPVENLSAGTYFVKFEHQNKSLYRKIIHLK